MWRYAVPDVTVRLVALVAPPTLAAVLAALAAGVEIRSASVEGLLDLTRPLFLLAADFARMRDTLPAELSDGDRDDLDKARRVDDDLPMVVGQVAGVIEPGGAGAGRGDAADISRRV